MPRIALVLIALLAVSGCVAYPGDGYYAQPTPVYVAPRPAVYLGGGFGGHRPHWGNRHYHRGSGHGGWGHRGWR